jgi:hypothetical protein
MALGDVIYTSGGALAYTPSNALAYKAIVTPSLTWTRYWRSGFGQGEDTYPDPPTEGKSDVWPLAVDSFAANSWSSASAISAGSYWGPYSVTGHRYARCGVTAGCASANVSAYAGSTLKRLSFTVNYFEQHDSISIYVGLLTGSSGTPGSGGTWHAGGTAATVSGTGSVDWDVNVTLSSYLFFTVYIADHEPPDAEYVYPTWVENKIGVTLGTVRIRTV